MKPFTDLFRLAFANRSTEAFWVAAIVFMTAICYLQVYDHQFLYDTVGFVLENPYVKEFSWSNTAWILTHAYRENWQPLTWLSHTLDFELFGNYAGAHHLVNVMIHLINGILLFYLIRRLIGHANYSPAEADVIAGVSALVFAIHPQHVESVAMIAERKDTLYCLITLVCCFAYLRYTGSEAGSKSRRRWYIYTLLIYTLDLIAKPMAVTLPAIFLVADLSLLTPAHGGGVGPLIAKLKDKIPMFSLAIVASIITVITQQTAMVPWEYLTVFHRIAHVIHNIGFYSFKFAVPVNLSPYYPFASLEEILSVSYWLPGLVFIALVTIACALAWQRGRPGFLFGWLYFLITLAPVAGFFQVGTAAATDHYVYMATIPYGAFLGWLAVAMIRRLPRSRAAVVPLAAAYILGLVMLAYVQVGFWRSPFRLWNRAVQLYPQAILPRRNLAVSYVEIGAWDAALEHLRLLPDGGADLVQQIEKLRREAGDFSLSTQESRDSPANLPGGKPRGTPVRP